MKGSHPRKHHLLRPPHLPRILRHQSLRTKKTQRLDHAGQIPRLVINDGNHSAIPIIPKERANVANAMSALAVRPLPRAKRARGKVGKEARQIDITAISRALPSFVATYVKC